MTNKHIPLEGRLAHISPEAAERMAGRPFEGKVPVLSYVEKKAWVMHGPVGAGKSTLAWDLYNNRRFIAEHAFNSTAYIGADEHGAMDAIPAYRQGVAAAPRDRRHDLWKTFQGDSSYIRSRSLDRALDQGYSVFLDTGAGGEGGVKLVTLLKKLGYHVRLVSAYASMPVCVERERGRERQADPAFLLTRRLPVLGNFNQIAALADTVSIRFSSAVHAAPSEVLYLGSERSATPGLRRRVMIGDRNQLGQMLTELRREGADPQLASLRQLMTVTGASAGELHRHGHAIARYIGQWAGPAGRLTLVPN